MAAQFKVATHMSREPRLRDKVFSSWLVDNVGFSQMRLLAG
jgi:hypothetical protein